jgi:hypothetical protein
MCPHEYQVTNDWAASLRFNRVATGNDKDKDKDKDQDKDKDKDKDMFMVAWRAISREPPNLCV